MARVGDPQLKQRAEALAAVLTAEQNPHTIWERLVASLQELPQQTTAEVVNFRNPRQNGRTAVHLAASKGLWECLEVLLKNGGDPNALSSHRDLRQTPLHLAAREGNGKCIELLLEKGADYTLENDRKDAALKLATDKACRDKLEHTIARLDVPQRSRTEESVVQRLHELVECGENHQFFHLYTNQPKEKVDLGTRWYDKHAQPEPRIEADGGSMWYRMPSEPGRTDTLLYRGCMNEAEEVVEFMLLKSPNQPLPNLNTGDTPLHAAAEKGNAAIVSKLLNHSSKLLLCRSSVGRTALHIACLKGHCGVVELILEHISKIVKGMKHMYSEKDPFSLDFRDSEEVTPLYLACLHGYPRVVKQLLTFRAIHGNLISLTVHAATKGGHTTLHAAAFSGSSEVVKLLFATGEVDPETLTPPILNSVDLIWRGIGGKLSEPTTTRKIFVSSTGDFVASTEGLMKGDRPLRLTALAEACVHGHSDIVDILLRHGIRDDQGLACRILCTVGNFDLCRKVLSHHCKMSQEEMRGSADLRDPDELWRLHLLWGEKKLPVLKGELFEGGATFTPSLQKAEYDDGKKRVQSRRNTKRTGFVTTRLPQNIDTSYIRSVTLKGNRLKIVPSQLFNLANVTFIDLSNNQLTSLPSSESHAGACGWGCTKLQDLKLSDNMLTELPVNMWILPELRMIVVDRNRLKKMVAGNVPTVFLPKTLQKVDVSRNDLTNVDPFLAEIKSLTHICLCYNHLSTLPLRIWDLQNLEELKVSNNRLTDLATCEGEAEDVEVEELGHSQEPETNPAMSAATRITGARAYVRPQVSRLPSLNPQKSIDANAYLSMEGFGQMDHTDAGPVLMAQDVSKLRKLDLSSNNFEEFPRDLPCIAPTLEELNLSDNPGITHVELQFVPPSLRRFQARNCRIECFGNVLNKEQLSLVKQTCVRQELRMQVCEHRNHTRLVNLSTLILMHNRLTHFQVLYHPLQKAGAPDFGAEEKTFEKELNPILLYPSLENLDLSHNNLQGRFNPNVAHLVKIKAIQLNDNEHLQVIPYELGYLKKLRDFTQLNLSNLPELVQPPKDIRDNMCQQVLTYLAAGLKESEPYRAIKLFLVGKTDGGKSTLLRRLSGQPDKMVGKTVGIDIVEFDYSPRHSMFSKGREEVHFIVWDFAGEDQYHATHHCFYSQRSLYIAVYNMTQEENGLYELDMWLRNIKLRAPGCPVVIVGTHMDQLKNKHRITQLQDFAKERYRPTDTPNDVYPHVVEVMSVSCKSTLLTRENNNIEKLKKTLYDISTHLHVGRDGYTLKYDPKMEEDSPRALFKQQVPKSFLTLRQRCVEYAKQCRDWAEPTNVQPHPQNGEGGSHNGTASLNGTDREEMKDPVMDEEEFRLHFGGLFNNDKEELDEAVSFLHLQGTLLHFDDHNLKDLYFLDPQWLAKLMAHVVHLQTIQTETKAIDGVLPAEELFTDHPISHSLKQKYIQLLEKFEVALKIGPSQVLIPSLMPAVGRYPQTGDNLRDIRDFADDFYVTVLRRFWLADFTHKGFWPRLICRVANDQQIVQILKKLIGAVDDDPQNVTLLDWTPWKMGVAFSHRGRTLLVVKEEDNMAPEADDGVEWLPSKKRIEIHVYAQDWFEVQNELFANGRPAPLLQNAFSLPGIATQLLMKISQHILSLAKVFRSLLETKSIYIPCWKCYGNMEPSADVGESAAKNNHFFPVVRSGRNIPVYAFHHEKCIILAAQGHNLQCPNHGPIKVVHTAPDLIFWDLASLSEYEQDMCSELRITRDETIGRGGFGFVCEGELLTKDGESKAVAVKGFLSPDSAEDTQDFSVEELLEISKQQENLYHAYKEIRQEVSFLAVLHHPNLTRLVGARTSPYMCLMLELAPHGSLSKALKVYKKYDVVLEPVTLQHSISQIANGMEYLHMKQIIHKDMKSANVLVWKFPSGRLPKEKRVEKAGSVWLKLTDYGISQVFTKPTMKLTGVPEGTPGFMAPELFGPEGHEISTEKVDVFAFGMVIYELLSLQAPFASVDVQKRNTLVKEEKRPLLPVKGLWSPLMAQDIMTMCWSHDPDKRPTMKKVTEWVATEEFGRLRAEMSIDRVESVSCACVCRIVVGDDRNEDEEVVFANGIGHHVGSSINSALKFDVGGHCRLRDMDSCTEYTRLQDGSPSLNSTGNILSPIQREHGRLVADGSEERFEVIDHKEADRSDYQRQFSSEAYTQVWVCDRKEKGGLLEIFSYCDTQPSYLVFVCKCRDQITAICPVRNMMWIGTAEGILKIKHTTTLNTKFKGELKAEEEPPSPRNTHVLAIVHVEKKSSVIVSTDTGEIWAFSDKLTREGLVIEEHMRLQVGTSCYQMVVVEVEGSVEVWGTLDNSQLLMLKQHEGRGWMVEKYEVECKLQQWQFFCIAHAAFEVEGGTTHNHLWLSYRQKGTVVSWDLQKRMYRATVDTASFREQESGISSPHAKVTAVVTSGRKVLVGTDVGTVGIIDSETCQVLYCLKWHSSKVRCLLLMPKEMEPCICSEVPLPEMHRNDSVGTKLLPRAATRTFVHQRSLSESDLTSLPDINPSMVVAAKAEESERRMVASVGNGRGGGVIETDLDKKNVTLLLWNC